MNKPHGGRGIYIDCKTRPIHGNTYIEQFTDIFINDTFEKILRWLSSKGLYTRRSDFLSMKAYIEYVEWTKISTTQ